MIQAAPFTISRDVKAPLALLFAVSSDPKHLANWFGPKGFKTTHADLDFRAGGSYHYCLEAPDGAEMWGLQRYLEIVPNAKIVHLQSFSDKDRNLTRHPMAPTWPLEMLATTTFADIGAGRSRLTISWAPHNADAIANETFEAGRPSMTGGFTGTFEQLEAYLAQLQA